MWPIVMSILGGPIQGLFKSWLSYRTSLATSKEAGAAVAMQADQQAFAQMAAAEIQIDAMKVQVYGSPTYRIVTMLVGLPVSAHFALVYVDTILAAKALYGHAVLGIPALPEPYAGYEWLIVASFFLVHSVNQGTSNLTKWLNAK